MIAQTPPTPFSLPPDFGQRKPQPIDAAEQFWVILALVLFGFLCVGVIFLYRRARGRRPTLVLPNPSAAPPASGLGVAAFVHADASRVDARALAAVVVELAARGALHIEYLAGDRLNIDVLDAARARSACEQEVVESIQAAESTPEDPWHGAPRGWWRRFVQAVIADARSAGLVEHVLWSEPLLAGVPPPPWPKAPLVVAAIGLGALTFALGWDPLAVGSIVLLFVILVSGARLVPWSLTSMGAKLQQECIAHRRWLNEHSHLEDVPASGVVVWGDHLARGAAFGLADRVVEQLAPSIAERTLKKPRKRSARPRRSAKIKRSMNESRG